MLPQLKCSCTVKGLIEFLEKIVVIVNQSVLVDDGNKNTLEFVIVRRQNITCKNVKGKGIRFKWAVK